MSGLWRFSRSWSREAFAWRTGSCCSDGMDRAGRLFVAKPGIGMRPDVRIQAMFEADMHLERSAPGSMRGKDGDALAEGGARSVLRDGQQKPRRHGGTCADCRCATGMGGECRVSVSAWWRNCRRLVPQASRQGRSHIATGQERPTGVARRASYWTTCGRSRGSGGNAISGGRSSSAIHRWPGPCCTCGHMGLSTSCRTLRATRGI